MRKTALLQLFSVLIQPPRPLAARSRDLPVPIQHSTLSFYAACDPHCPRQCALSSIRRLARFGSSSSSSSPPHKLDRESHPNEGSRQQQQPPSCHVRDGEVAFTWDELRQIVATKAFHRLCRSEWQQRRYEAYQRHVQKSWKSVYDHVYVRLCASNDGSDSSRVAPHFRLSGLLRLCQKFHLERRKEGASGLWCAVSPSNSTAVRISLVRNLFPYHLAKGIEHYVLWKMGGPPGAGISREEVDAAITGLLKQIPAASRDDTGGACKDFGTSSGSVGGVLYWVNPPSLQSLPSIRHAHVLCRRDRPKTHS
jgi:Protein of unknown function (DUF3605)